MLLNFFIYKLVVFHLKLLNSTLLGEKISVNTTTKRHTRVSRIPMYKHRILLFFYSSHFNWLITLYIFSGAQTLCNLKTIDGKKHAFTKGIKAAKEWFFHWQSGIFLLFRLLNMIFGLQMPIDPTNRKICWFVFQAIPLVMVMVIEIVKWWRAIDQPINLHWLNIFVMHGTL